MTETERLTPALTVAEWETLMDPREARYSFLEAQPPDMLHRRVAHSNHLLPDDHPGKITQRDVDGLFFLHIGIDAALKDESAGPVHQALDAFLDKIRAILPPRSLSRPPSGP